LFFHYYRVNENVKKSGQDKKNSEKIDLDFLVLKYKRKRNNKFQIDLSDNRLKDLYINSEFFIDPLHPYYLKYRKLKQVQKKITKQKDVILKQKVSLPTLVKKLKLKQVSNTLRNIRKI
jgi:hypothetical protein